MHRSCWVFILFSLIAFPFSGQSQNALQQEWIKPEGGNVGLTSLEAINNRFLLCGYIWAPNPLFGCLHCDSTGNALLLVTDSSGNKIYSHCYGGSAADQFLSARSGKDNSIWALGYFNSTDGDFPDTAGKIFGLVKFDSAYTPMWYHFYGSNAENDYGDFIATSDGGALILASTNYARGDIPYKYGNDPLSFDAYLCKLDSLGKIKWIKVLGGSGNETAMSVKELVPNQYSVLINTNSVDYMLTGLNFDSLNASPWLLKIDTGGHILSSRVAQNLPSFESQDFMQVSNDGWLLTGTYRPLSDSDFCHPGLGVSDFATVTVDSAYYRQWCKTMGGSGNDNTYYMVPINDSVLALCGVSESIDGGLVRCAPFPLSYTVNHSWLGLINTNTEELLWQTSFCSSHDVFMRGMSFDSTSQSLYLLMLGGIDGDFESAAVSGTTSNTYLFKYSLLTVTDINWISKIKYGLSLFPNPANNTSFIKIDEPNQMTAAVVFDAAGRQIVPLFSNQHLSTFEFKCNTLSPGLYFVTIEDMQGNVGVLKLIKE